MKLKANKICQKCRRANQKLFLKGEKCLSSKCPFTKRAYAPGQHGQNPTRTTEYGRQLREKQKAAQIYGITDRQFRNYYQKALRKKGMTDLALLRFLEMRLDNILYRLGFASSRREAKALIRDGHIVVNSKKVTSPSFQLKVNDLVGIRELSQKKQIFQEIKEKLKKAQAANWLKLYPDKLQGQIIKIPEREDIETPIDEQIILEYFAR